ncbi:MAG TPA: HAD family hydrolase [Gemmatimonadota bacterium]|nr:HAD family hydrolase [Gemmatimonadota bacterium]
MIDVIAFDADDTLWENEGRYRDTEAEFRRLLEQYHSPEWIDDRLYETEMRNLPHFGYGIKAFVLSMVETAIDLTEGRIGAADIQRVIELGRTMIAAPVELLDGVAETVAELARDHELMIITKGDLLEQESKVERSGLGDHFGKVEIVSRKDQAAYERIAARHGFRPERFLMVGNSLRSDVLPVLAMGGRAVHIPYWTTWRHEEADEAERAAADYARLDSIRELPEYMASAARA